MSEITNVTEFINQSGPEKLSTNEHQSARERIERERALPDVEVVPNGELGVEPDPMKYKIVLNDEIVGSVSIELNGDTAYWISGIYIHDSHRGKGIGLATYVWAIEVGQKPG